MSSIDRKRMVINIEQSKGAKNRTAARVAIAESRLLRLDNKDVSFRYYDYSDDSKQKILSFDLIEFIRRFLLHVLPSGFMRIRHYGFLSNSNRKRSREMCEKVFKIKPKESNTEQSKKKVLWHERMEKETGVNPLCGKNVEKRSWR